MRKFTFVIKMLFSILLFIPATSCVSSSNSSEEVLKPTNDIDWDQPSGQSALLKLESTLGAKMYTAITSVNNKSLDKPWALFKASDKSWEAPELLGVGETAGKVKLEATSFVFELGMYEYRGLFGGAFWRDERLTFHVKQLEPDAEYTLIFSSTYPPSEFGRGIIASLSLYKPNSNGHLVQRWFIIGGTAPEDSDKLIKSVTHYIIEEDKRLSIF